MIAGIAFHIGKSYIWHSILNKKKEKNAAPVFYNFKGRIHYL